MFCVTVPCICGDLTSSSLLDPVYTEICQTLHDWILSLQGSARLFIAGSCLYNDLSPSPLLDTVSTGICPSLHYWTLTLEGSAFVCWGSSLMSKRSPTNMVRCNRKVRASLRTTWRDNHRLQLGIGTPCGICWQTWRVSICTAAFGDKILHIQIKVRG